MVDSFIDIAIWFTIIILCFNVLAMSINATTVNPNLKLFTGNQLVVFDDGDLNFSDTNFTNTIGDGESTGSTINQNNVQNQNTDLVSILVNLFFMWAIVLNAVIPPAAGIITLVIITIMGIVQMVGLLALGFRAAVAIGALLPF